MDTNDESDESGAEYLNQAAVTPGRSPANECDFSFVSSSFGHAQETLLKAPTKLIGVELAGKLLK